MSWRKRGIRIVRIALLAVAGLSLALYGLGIPNAWWKPPLPLFFYAHDGQLMVEWWGPRTRVRAPKPPVGLNFPSQFSIDITASALYVEQHDHWIWTWYQIRPSLTSLSRHDTRLNIYLSHLAMLTGPPGIALLFVRTRRIRPGRCPRCEYDLSGLAVGAACPECGSAIGVYPATAIAQ